MVNGNPFTLEEVNSYALAQHEAGNLQTALDIYNLILAQIPNDALALSNRGNTLKAMHRHPEALASYESAIRQHPGFADAHSNYGNALQELGRHTEAFESYEKAIKLNPNHAIMHFNRGTVLKKLARYEDAVKSYDRSVELDPHFALAFHARGISLYELKRFEEALASYDMAIAINPELANAHGDRGAVLLALKRFDESLQSFERAITLKPDYAEAYDNRGATFQEMQRYDDALANYEKAIAINPGCADAYWNKGLLKLLLGEYKEGWKLYEWRWKSFKKVNIEAFEKQLWLGQQPVAGKKLLIHMEQGLGDAIQFCRYVPMISALGANIILRVQPALLPVMATLKGDFQLIKDTDIIPEYDFHCPVMSLPLAMGTTLTTIPADIPYLFADPNKEKTWQEVLGIKHKQRIGLVWSGGTQHINDRNRSIRLSQLAPVLNKNFEFHSLQKEYRVYDEEYMSKHGQVLSHARQLGDFADTAALISQMDMVISVDTSVAHLAAALGKPVWLMVTYVPDFRWLTERQDSPWYPTLRLFRQPNPGDWESVVASVANGLDAFS